MPIVSHSQTRAEQASHVPYPQAILSPQPDQWPIWAIWLAIFAIESPPWRLQPTHMQSPSSKFRAIALILVLLFVPLYCPPPSSATNVEVVGQSDSYLMSGGVIHHSNFTKDRDEAATCSNCFWKITEICKSWLDTNHGSCPWLRLQCPVDMQLVQVFRANANSRPEFSSDEWYLVGYSCIGEAGPISTLDISIALKQSSLQKIPTLRIRYLPSNDAILWQVLRYEVLSKESINRTRTVLGVKVTLHARSSINFECKKSTQNSHCITSNPNELKFKEVGLFRLTATSTWQATYDALGVKGIEVQGVNPSSSSTNLFNVHPLFTHLS